MSKNIVINGERVYPGQYVFIDSEEHGELTGRIYYEHKSSYDVMTEYGKVRFSKKDNSSYAFGCSDVVAVALNKNDVIDVLERIREALSTITFSAMSNTIKNFQNSLTNLKIKGEQK